VFALKLLYPKAKIIGVVTIKTRGNEIVKVLPKIIPIIRSSVK